MAGSVVAISLLISILIPSAHGCGCLETCQYAADGGCDDGGPGNEYNCDGVACCALGTDCTDVGEYYCSNYYNGEYFEQYYDSADDCSAACEDIDGCTGGFFNCWDDDCDEYSCYLFGTDDAADDECEEYVDCGSACTAFECSGESCRWLPLGSGVGAAERTLQHSHRTLSLSTPRRSSIVGFRGGHARCRHADGAWLDARIPPRPRLSRGADVRRHRGLGGEEGYRSESQRPPQL